MLGLLLEKLSSELPIRLCPSASTPSHLEMGVQGLQPSIVPSSDQLGRQPSLYAVLVSLVLGEVH
jgi:hypothetical protein